MCAPRDIWSLGVILITLTCGRNPWKQASFDDPTYRMFAQSGHFLRTVLPLTAEVTDILIHIFNPNPELRITIPKLRDKIMACARFTVPRAAPAISTIIPNPSRVTDDRYDCESHLRPVPLSSYQGSLRSSAASIDDQNEDTIPSGTSQMQTSPKPLGSTRCWSVATKARSLRGKHRRRQLWHSRSRHHDSPRRSRRHSCPAKTIMRPRPRKHPASGCRLRRTPPILTAAR